MRRCHLPRAACSLLFVSLLLSVAAGCGGSVNTPPTASIVSPASGSTLYPGSISFVGTVSDAETDVTGLQATFSAGGQSCSSTAGADGTVACALNLTLEQTYTVELSVIDSEGSTGTAESSIVVRDEPPAVTIQSPPDGSTAFTQKTPVTLVAKVTDPDDPALECIWSSDLDGTLGSAPVDITSSLCSFTVSSLSGGTHYLLVQVTDAVGKAAEAAIYLPIKPCTDGDFDGYSRECDGDCNDSNAAVHPGAPEVCGDRVDNDCDGAVDTKPDGDGDGFNECTGDCDDSDPQVSPIALEVCDNVDNNCLLGVDETADKDRDGVSTCAEPVPDCDDDDPAKGPQATETCDGEDDDCDDLIDDGAALTFYGDADGDGYGNPATPVEACAAPEGTVQNKLDCDDSDPSILPGALEACNGKDDDCDGSLDEGTTPIPFYPDADGDGYGSGSATQSGCVPPDGFAVQSGDCDDDNALVNPGATEVCDLEDNDCDGETDELVILTFYKDVDGDGYGIGSDTKTGCTAPAGYAGATGDCNDADASIHPNALEQCDSLDNNCNGKIDDDVTIYTWYYDGDKDTYGTSSNTKQSCSQPTGYVSRSGDCDDSSAAVSPAAVESCNGKDDDCDAQVDEGVQTTYWRDADSDKYGGSTQFVLACSQPQGYVASSTDCNDSNATIYPGAAELCDGLDNDCDQILDEGLTQQPFYRDADQDNYGNASSQQYACKAPPGYVGNSTDCNDSSNKTYPGALETCDGADNDCDTTVDEGTECYDDDKDGYTEKQGDCNDADANVAPNKAESTSPNGKDDNCNGKIDENTVCWDDDGDGYIENASATSCPGYPGAYGGTVPQGGDCNDSAKYVNPGAPEYFNGSDDNCDSSIDGTIPLAHHWVILRGEAANGQVGAASAKLGDINGDGYDDLAVGAPGRDLKRGAAHVVLGKPSGWTSGEIDDLAITLSDDLAESQAGLAISSAGDLNGDGLSDFAVGAPYRKSIFGDYAGYMYVFYGKATGWASGYLKDVAPAWAYGIQSNVLLGSALAGGGDINGDGYDDLMLGGPWPSGLAQGYLMVLPGRATAYNGNISSSELFKVNGSNGDALGSALAIAGPANSDSIDDMVVAGYGSTSGLNARTNAGVVYFISGTSRLNTQQTFPVTDLEEVAYRGSSDYEKVGYSVSAAGDVNDDGFSDFLVGREEQTSSDQGLAYLVFGGSLPGGGALQTAADVYFTGETDACPCTVAGVGDVNGDLIDDFVVGVSGSDINGLESGSVYLFYGSSSWSSPRALSSANVIFRGATGDRAGASVSAAGDVNNDGYADFLIGAPGFDATGVTDAGRAFVMLGFRR